MAAQVEVTSVGVDDLAALVSCRDVQLFNCPCGQLHDTSKSSSWNSSLLSPSTDPTR